MCVVLMISKFNFKVSMCAWAYKPLETAASCAIVHAHCKNSYSIVL